MVNLSGESSVFCSNVGGRGNVLIEAQTLRVPRRLIGKRQLNLFQQSPAPSTLPISGAGPCPESR
ncbi:MAG: hypothetical protein ABI614_02655, partial [Planctomycetota bacterium]